MEEEEELRGIVRGDKFSVQREESSSTLCPLVLLVKVAWKKVRTLGRKISKFLRSGRFLLWSREDEAEPVGRILNAVECHIWMTAYDGIQITVGGVGLGGNVYYSEGCMRSVKCNAVFGVKYSAFAITSRKTTGNFDGLARLKDFPDAC